jgi:hypothetical protein
MRCEAAAVSARGVLTGAGRPPGGGRRLEEQGHRGSRSRARRSREAARPGTKGPRRGSRSARRATPCQEREAEADEATRCGIKQAAGPEGSNIPRPSRDSRICRVGRHVGDRRAMSAEALATSSPVVGDVRD